MKDYPEMLLIVKQTKGIPKTRLLYALDEFGAGQLRDMAEAAIRIAYFATQMAQDKEDLQRAVTEMEAAS